MRRWLLPLARLKWAVETVVFLGLASLMVRFVPIRFWRQILHKTDQTPGSAERVATNSRSVEQTKMVGWWVASLAGLVWFKPACLAQAIAGWWMLRRRGIAAVVQVGARSSVEPGDDRFHAWLVSGNAVIIGGRIDEAYAVFQRGA
jgi:hypothetical protein